MTVYKYFIKIALRNKWIILPYTIIFFVISLINGSNFKEREASFTETRLTIGIINNSNSELSNSLTEYLEEENNIIETQNDEEYIKEQIFLEMVDAVVIIPEDFTEKVINKEESIVIYKDDRKTQSIQIKNQINKFLSFINITYENSEFDINCVTNALDEKVEVKLIEDNNTINFAASEWFRYYFNFTGYVIIAIYIAVIGLVMTDFTDKNIDNRMNISSKRFVKLNKEIYLGQLTIAALITTVFILGSVVMKGKYIGEVDFGKHIVNLVVFSFSILSLTFLINNITRNRFVKNALSTVLSLGTAFISGVMVPQEILEDKVLTVAKFFPTYYFVRVNDAVINSLLDVRYELFMQLLFAVAFLIIGLYFSKKAQRV